MTPRPARPALAVLAAAASAALAAAPARAASPSPPEPAPLPPGGCALPPLAAPLRLSTGEVLTFDLDLLGAVKAGRMEVRIDRPMSGGRIVPVRSRARSDASFGGIKELVAVAISWIDLRAGLPERYTEESDEDGRRRAADVKLLPHGPEIVLETRDRDRTGRTVVPREREVLDPISALVRLRAAPLRPGDAYCFDLVGNGRPWRVEARVAPGTEKVDSGAGRFETVRIDAVGRRADRPAVKREVHLWLSTDPRRLLVAAVTEVELGPVRAMLASAEGGVR